MTIDELARASAAAAYRKAVSEVEVIRLRHELDRRRRRRNTLGLAALALLIAVVAVGSTLATVASRRGGAAPASPTRSMDGPASPTCAADEVCRLDDSRVIVGLAEPVAVRFPANFKDDVNVLNHSTLEVYRNDDATTGVTVYENPSPVMNTADLLVDRSAGTTASSMATWLATRPFLAATTETRTTVDGRPAWVVTGRLRNAANLQGSKNGAPAAPTFVSGQAQAAFTSDLTGTYTLLDLPGSGVVVIWSWNASGDPSLVAANQALIDGLHFGTP